MPELLSVSRAARLVGVSRGVIQQRIKDGELPTFEGMVSAEDLLRVFPDVSLEHDAVFERVTRIKDAAYGRRIRERVLPDAEVLAARLAELGRHYAQARAQAELYKDLLRGLDGRLARLARDPGPAGREAATLREWLDRTLAQQAAGADLPPALLAQDSLLRLMSAQVKFLPSGHEFFVEGSDTLLDAALRAGWLPAYGCSDGSCGRCRAQVMAGQYKWLGPNHLPDGEILLCQTTAVTDLVVEAGELAGPADLTPRRVAGQVKRLAPLGTGVWLLHLRTPPDQRLQFISGQRVRLRAGGLESDLLPVASCPCDAHQLQFHLADTDPSPFVQSLSGMPAGTPVEIEGPYGEFVLDLNSTRPLLFLAGELGFAPIKSLIEHALALEGAPILALYWYSDRPGGQYLDNLCRSWADALEYFHYLAVERLAPGADVAARVAADHADLPEWDVYLAGPPAWIEDVGLELRARGVPRARIRAEGC